MAVCDEVDAGHDRATAGEPRQIGADAASHLEQAPAGEAGEVDELGQVAQLVEAVVVEVGEELAAAHRVRGHLEIVDALVPVAADLRRWSQPAIVQCASLMRDLRRLADDTFDLLVVGAGIYGALAAWDAAQRGCAVALVDRGDFGGGTSFNSLKTLHGGLRSLQSLSLRADAAVHPRAAGDGPDGAASGAAAALLRPDLRPSHAQRPGAARGPGGDRRGRCATATPASTTRPAAASRAGRVPRRVPDAQSADRSGRRHRRRGVVRLPDAAGRAGRRSSAVQSAEAGGAVAANYVEARGLVRAGQPRGRRHRSRTG